MARFEPEKKLQYMTFEADRSVRVKFLELLPTPHEDFTLGKGKKAKPAQIYKVRNLDADEDQHLTITSTYLREALDMVEKAHGTIFGIPMEIFAIGKDKQRRYAIEVDEKELEQARLSAA